MRSVAVRNPRHGTVLGSVVGVADRWWLRLRGLLGRPPLRPGEGLLLVPCRGIHTLGMPGPLDVAVLDQEGSVIAAYPELPPGKRTPLHRASHAVLELPPGTLAASGTGVGDRLVWDGRTEGPKDRRTEGRPDGRIEQRQYRPSRPSGPSHLPSFHRGAEGRWTP